MMFSLVKNAFLKLKSNWRLSLFFYFLNTILASIIGFLFYKITIFEANNTLELNSLLHDFDFMVFSDFMNQSGKAYFKLIPFIIVLALFYMVVQVFVKGGKLWSLKYHKFIFLEFINESKIYFGRMLGLFFLQLLYQVLVFLVYSILFISGILLADGGNERTYFFFILPSLVFFVLGICFFIIVGIYASVMIYDSNTTVFKAFNSSVKLVLKNFKTVLAFGSIIILQFVFWLIYIGVESVVSTPTWFLLVFIVILQQTFVFLRVFCSLWNVQFAIEFQNLILEKEIKTKLSE